MRQARSAPPADLIAYAPAVFAPTSYARLRLIRQMHACGLLSGRQAVIAAPDPRDDAEHDAGAARRELTDGSPRASC